LLLVVALAAATPALGLSDAAVVLTETSNALPAGDGAGAFHLAETALAAPDLSRPERAQLLVDRGLAHELRGERSEALVDFTAAIEMHVLAAQAQARALFDRGVTLDELGRTADALGDYSAAIRLVPGYASALNNRANVYRRQGRADAARPDYLAALKAVNLHPEFSYFGLGQLAEARGDNTGARDFYAKAVAANPAYGEAQMRLAALESAPETPITLRPPPGATTVALRPPQAVQLHPPLLNRPAVSQKPVAGDPLLRPALDSQVRGPGGLQVQLGAWRSQAEAEAGWDRAQARAGALLSGAGHQIVPVDLPGRGRYFRLRAQPDKGTGNPCAALEARGVECMTVPR
jgi:tetratricopeptide (TPR) repeat protein